MKTVDWHTDGGKCLDVISTSYDDLPIHLKPCFLYFALFPEDYQIKAASLIQMWIAEGFIQEMPTKTMEDTGENYIEELAQRYHFLVIYTALSHVPRIFLVPVSALCYIPKTSLAPILK